MLPMPRPPMQINRQLAARMRNAKQLPSDFPLPPPFRPPELPAGVVAREDRMAMDDAMVATYAYANSAMCLTHEAFLGYPILAQLTQKPEFRLLSEKTAQAMVRKWVKFEGKNPERIKELEAELDRLNVRDLFAEAAKYDGFFGRAQLFIDMGQHEGEELQTPLVMVKEKLYGRLRKFKIIEPMYSYPFDYRADNPMADSYYNPQAWYIMGNKVHSSRLLLFVSRPLPDMLKPAYNFSGMSMSQLALPYVENFLKTRDSVNKMISTYSMPGIKSNMSAVLMGDSGDDLIARGELYNSQRDNQGLFVLDNETEEFFHYQAQLGTLDKLQAQSQEHMSSISSTPLVVLFGISPAGLNASTDGELRVYYDYIKDMQHALFRDNLKLVCEVVQLSKWGEIDPSIKFDFIDLWEPTPEQAAAVRKTDAETDQIRMDTGVVTPDEVRDKVSADPTSGYAGLPTMPPELKERDEGTDITEGDDPSQAGAPERGE
ncbi:MAG: DUF1073 domain-containing protein [Sulfitobacter sp.]|nr:DUF1073 domain-containing protein [Sulfitobacter sp.]